VDVGDLPNHVKYCVLVCLASNGQLSEHHWSTYRGLESPTIGIRASSGLKCCLIFARNWKLSKLCLTIPLCRGERDEATGENNVKIRRLTWPHAPTRWLSKRADAPHASSSPGWPNPTWIPVDLTHVSDPDKDDVSMHRWHAMSVPSQMTRQHSGTHMPRH